MGVASWVREATVPVDLNPKLFDRFNLGQGRDIPRQHSRGVKVHRSVKLRMEAKFERKEDKYEPQANLDVEPHWID